MAKVSAELQAVDSATLPLLAPYSGTGAHRGTFLLRAGPWTYAEERMLKFLGQIIGIALRLALAASNAGRDSDALSLQVGCSSRSDFVQVFLEGVAARFV
jgi:GAF domain-containing protein